MGKKKKTSSDQVRQKRKQTAKKTNPFEVKVNRQKHHVLGRKVQKQDTGMPGVSRSKATKRRKETLLKEYKQQNKSNRFLDKRIGENDASVTPDEMMMKRFALERAKSERINKYNLNEEEELTHYGQSLSEIEKFDDPVVSDEEDDDDDRRAAAKLVSEQHFGGFMTKKTEGEEGSKTWKEKMEELISQSKKAKYERQKEKDESNKLTEELDEQWTSLQRLITDSKRGKGKQEENTESKADDYDIAVRQLQFEIKGKPTDRLKTEEEIAKEEKERLEKLEADRMRRMKGITTEESGNRTKYRSADDLDDGFALDTADFDYVSYKDGKILTEKSNDTNQEEVDDDEDGIDDEEEDGGSGDGNVDGDDDKEEDTKLEEENGDGSDNDSDVESDDSYNDLASDEEEENDNEDITEKEATVSKTIKKSSQDKEKSEMMESAKKELPYTFEAPKTYDDLLEVLEGHDLEDQLTIITRMRKCHHPSLAEGNKQKLEVLFTHLVQFFCDLCIQDPPQLEFADRLTQHLFELTQLSPLAAAQAVVMNIADRQEEFRQICEKKAGRGLYPGLDTMLLLKLVSVLFPTSDFYHPVTTPSLLFMCQILSKSPVNHGRDIAAGLFLSNLCLEYVSSSKRFIPEVINFLHGLIFLAADKQQGKIEQVVPPFKPVGKNINLLHMTAKAESCDTKWSVSDMLSTEVEAETFDSDTFRMTAIHQTLVLLDEFSKLYTSLPCYREIFTPVLSMCEKLPRDLYTDTVQTTLKDFVCRCEESCDKKQPFLVMLKKKPRPLKMFEPKMEETFDGKKKKKRGTRDFNEKQKLLHKHKKEMKGARREIKKDNQFLARQKLKDQLEKDAERKKKVKNIYHLLSTQEGDYKKMKRGHVT